MERKCEWNEGGGGCCLFFFQVILYQTRIDRELAFTNSEISSNDRSRAYFPYNYLISKSVITWQKQKFNRINGWRAECVCVCAHRAHCLFESRWVRGDDDDDSGGGSSSIDYAWYIHNIGNDARDIVPTMLIIFPINKYTHTERERVRHSCAYMISPIEIPSRFICVHSFGKTI